MRSLPLSLMAGLTAAVLADEVPWTYDTTGRTEPVPSLVARNVAAAESAAPSDLDAWAYSFALLHGLSIDASPRGIAIIIR